MNSLLQQLFMNKYFVRDIMSKEFDRENIAGQVQVVFGVMKKKLWSTYDPTGIFKFIKDFDGESISIDEQKDVYEFFNLFTCRLEETSKDANLFKRTFGGVYSNEITGLECFHKSETNEDFLSINLQVKGKNNLQAGLNSFIESEELKGENAYYCERCERKENASKRVTFKLLPNYLMIILKRFEYDYKTGRKEKINDYYEFPFTLNMQQYTTEYQNLKDNISFNIKNLNLTHASDYYQYDLKGVILHLGTGESGHYTCLIRDNNEWYEFNDSKVTEFDIKRMPEEAFGGKAEVNNDLLMFEENHELFQRIKNAYVLTYERRCYYKIKEIDLRDYESEELMLKEYEKFKVQYIEPLIPDNLSKIIIQEMVKSCESQTVLTRDFSKFVCRSIENYSPSMPMEYKTLREIELQRPVINNPIESIEVWKFFSLFIFTTLLRLKKDEQLDLYYILKSYNEGLAKNTAMSFWLIETFCNWEVITEFFISSPSEFTRFFCSSSLITAVKVLYPLEQSSLQDLVKSQKEWANCLDREGKRTTEKEIVLPKNHNVPLLFILVNNLAKILLSSAHDSKLFKSVSFVLAMICRNCSEIVRFINYFQVVEMGFEILLGISEVLRPESYNIPYITIDKEVLFDLTMKFKTIPHRSKFKLQPKCYRIFIDLLGLLVSDCALYNAPLPNHYILKEEEFLILYYLGTKGITKKLLKLVSGRTATHILAKALSHICINDNVIDNLTSDLYSLIIEADDTELEKYVICLEYLISINDGYKEQKVKNYAENLCTMIVKTIHSSYVTCTYMIDTFIRLAIKLPILQKLIQEKKCKVIKNWLNDNKYPKVII